MIGKMRHRLEIQRLTETPADEFNQPGDNWRTIARRWGEVEPLGGREAYLAKAVSPDLTHNVTMRGFVGLTTKDRIKWGTRCFNIVTIGNPHERGGTTLIKLVCIEDLTVTL